MEASLGSSRSTSREDRRLALTERLWDFLVMVLLGRMWEVRYVCSKHSRPSYLTCQSIDAKSPFGWILPWNLQDRNGSEARTGYFPGRGALRRSSQDAWNSVGQQLSNRSNGENFFVTPLEKKTLLFLYRPASVTADVRSGVVAVVPLHRPVLVTAVMGDGVMVVME